MMSGYFNDQTLQDIESRIDIVELIGENVSYSGGEIAIGDYALSYEKTPSFSVSQDKQLFTVLAAMWGQSLHLYYEKDGVEFRQAVEILAQKPVLASAHRW